MESKGSRQDDMTWMERMMAMLNGQPLDRVPFWLFGKEFSAVNVGYTRSSIYRDPEQSFWSQICTNEMYGADEFPYFACPKSLTLEFGGEIKFPTSQYDQGTTVVRYPIESEEDFEKLELPDVKTAGLLPQFTEFARLQASFGLPVFLNIGTGLGRAAYLLEVNKLYRSIIRKPRLVHRLLRLITDHALNVVKYWVDTFGAENILLWEGSVDSNQIISPRQFEEFSFPYIKELNVKVLAMGIKHIFFHICGEHNLNLPYWVQVPMGNPGIVSFGHEVDLSTAIKYFGDTCIIAGNFNPAVVQTGPPQQVYELCKQCLEKAKYAPRGFILMPGCSLPPMSPPYNVHMMRKAIQDFGWYG
ncbi:uroporphyrinogen decarboxylase family protein [Candidatus Omnitrophota bacterium]